MNILLIIAFKGTNYHGFQVQQNAITICEVLQDAMFKLWKEKPDIKGCSRTDSGVHAKQYCLNFWYNLKMSLYKLPLSLNAFLPQDIRVLKAIEVLDEFHARYNCVKKEYLYIFLNSHVEDPFQPGLYYRVSAFMDSKKMHQASQCFLGTHHFNSFMSANSDIKDTKRTIYSAKVEQKDCRIIFSVSANGFLYNMVRIMAGTLLDIGLNRKKIEEIPTIIKKQDRYYAGDTLPAKGLFLNRVFYDEKYFLNSVNIPLEKERYF